VDKISLPKPSVTISATPRPESLSKIAFSNASFVVIRARTSSAHYISSSHHASPSIWRSAAWTRCSLRKTLGMIGGFNGIGSIFSLAGQRWKQAGAARRQYIFARIALAWVLHAGRRRRRPRCCSALMGSCGWVSDPMVAGAVAECSPEMAGDESRVLPS